MNPLAVTLNRLQLPNPVMVASGTFGYAKEMAAYVNYDKLGGIIPKTVTPQPRAGNPPPRTVEATSGLLNSIGLDNDGIDQFIESHLEYLLSLEAPIIANIASHDVDEFGVMASKLNAFPQLAGIELNISCPNVSGGVDFGTNPDLARQVVATVRDACDIPIITKLTPNITDITEIAQATKEGGTDAVSLVNTFQGMAIDWRSRMPILGAGLGGLSGPAIKPLALRCVWQVAQKVDIPIIGIGGIANIDDVMEFLVAGATAIQIGTANFYNPSLAGQLVDELQTIVKEENVKHISEFTNSIKPAKITNCD